MAKKKAEAKKQILEKKKKLISKKKKLKKTLEALISTSSDSDSDSETTYSLQKLLEPYPKDQLIEILASSAVSDASLAAKIRAVADRDVSHRKIFVHGLGWDTVKETLRSLFEGFGEIEDCNVIVDRTTGKSKGYGFVLFKERKGAEKALREPRKKIGSRMASCQLSSVGPVATATTPAGAIPDGMTRKIYVSNVPTNADKEKLRAFFAKFGEIETGPLGFDSQTGKSRGFALFVYKTVESAKKALQEEYKLFDGHQLRCQQATESKNKGTVGGGTATITTAIHPVQPPAATNPLMVMMSQQYQYPSLNPLYSGLLTNPLMAPPSYVGLGQAGAYGSTGPGLAGKLGGSSGSSELGAYGATGLSLGGKLGGALGSSVLGAYGATGSGQVGLQHEYSAASARTLGATGLANPLYKR